VPGAQPHDFAERPAAPYLRTYFTQTHHATTFNYYAIGLCLLSLITALLLPETNGKDLNTTTATSN
jgi:hypothetical protein